MKRVLSTMLIILLVFFLALPATAEENTDTSTSTYTYTYTDEANGNQLSVPSQWDLEPVENSLVKAKFVPSSGASALMQYGSADLWDSLSSAQKQIVRRSDVNNSLYSKSSIAELLGCSSSDINMVTVNGMEYFQAVTEKTYTDSLKFTITVTYWAHIENGWFYLYQFSGDESHNLYYTFKNMVGSATYGNPADADDLVYKSAVKAYEKGNYLEAESMFNRISSYQDSSKYLRLIRIRNAGSNPGMGGSVYNHANGLTASQKKDIDAAANDFYFADTAKVLLCNSDVACYYLQGRWEGGPKCYIEFYANEAAGTSYYIGSKLSTNYQGTYSIEDGELWVDILYSNALTLSLTLTAPDSMEVYTYEKSARYTLNR